MTVMKALVVDDEPDLRQLLAITLKREGIESVMAGSLAEARQQLQQHTFDFCLTDMRLPDGNGIELVEFVRAQNQSLPMAVITAYGSMEAAIRAFKAGAFDFVTKPVDLRKLRQLIKNASQQSSASVAAADKSSSLLLGQSEPIVKIRQVISQLSKSLAPVYITGESGTGKELAGRDIHNLSSRSEQPFVAINCGAIPLDLIESELFGHKKGSFTGAHANKVGLFQAAEGGTLFLDEVADLPFDVQVKLLRVLQEKSVRPVGSTEELAIDVRVLCATHNNLAELVEQGKFRQDLYYRLNVIELVMPPLREHWQDISEISGALLQRLASREGSEPGKLSQEALAKLESYLFPGNVRELENILERAVALSASSLISADDIAFPSKPERVPVKMAAEESGSLEEQARQTMGQLEKQAIENALEQCRWNKTKAAELLGISLRSLRYRVKKFGIE